jgi:hypothetical protein
MKISTARLKKQGGGTTRFNTLTKKSGVWTVGSSIRRPTSCGVLSDSMEQMSTQCIQIFVKFLHTFPSRSVVWRGVEQVGSRHYVLATS